MLPWGNKCDPIQQNQSRKAVDYHKNVNVASQNQRREELKKRSPCFCSSSILFSRKINVVVFVHKTNHNDFKRISTQAKLINDDSIKNINRLKLCRVKL